MRNNALKCIKLADGLPTECYKAFQEALWDLFNAAAFSGSFPKEMLQVIIVTLLKPGNEPNVPKNFRPICLFNTDLHI